MKCPYCNQETDATHEWGIELLYDGDNFIDVFKETCSHCEKNFLLKEVFTYSHVEIQTIDD